MNDRHYIDLIHYTPNPFNRERFLVGAILTRAGDVVAELIRAPLPPFKTEARVFVERILDLQEPSRPPRDWEIACAINDRSALVRVEESSISLGQDIDPVEWLQTQIFTQWAEPDERGSK